MKIQCSGCGAAEAEVLCCADEAALCLRCDEKVHAVNKVAGKHQRVPLSKSVSPMPKCDICQETFGYFFCMEDRALLCRKCDIAVHTVNAYVAGHQRLLLTGVKVGSGATEIDESPREKLSSTGNLPSVFAGRIIDQKTALVNPDVPQCDNAGADGTVRKSIMQWQECLGMADSSQNNVSIQEGSSKVEGMYVGDSEWSRILRSTEEQLLGDAPDDISWIVPENFSPSTTSRSPRDTRKITPDKNVLMPSISCDTRKMTSGKNVMIPSIVCDPGEGVQFKQNHSSTKRFGRQKRPRKAKGDALAE